MNNAEYVKSLGLEFKNLTAKLEEYWEPSNLCTWDILNKKTNEQIGSYTSFDKGEISTIVGEWLLQEAAYIIDDYSLNIKIISICRTFAGDVDLLRCPIPYYSDKINKILGEDICKTVSYTTDERDNGQSALIINYHGTLYVLVYANKYINGVNYKEIETFVKDYNRNNIKYIDLKVYLINNLCAISMAFVDDTSISDHCLYTNHQYYFAKRQGYKDKINKFLGKDLCDIWHVSFPNGEKAEIYVEYNGKHYTLGYVCGEKRDVCRDKINEFVNAYMEDIKNE